MAVANQRYRWPMVSSTSFTAPASNRQVVQPAQDSAQLASQTKKHAPVLLRRSQRNAGHVSSSTAHALAKFWAPVPWLLEASIVLETVLHKYYEAGVIAALLLFNAALLPPGESRSGHTCCSQIPSGAQRRGAARRRMEDSTRRNWYAAT